MARITRKEKKRFKKIFNAALKKLESPKNIKKNHWSTATNKHLITRIFEETLELQEAIYNGFPVVEGESECFDIINLALFVADNLRECERLAKCTK